MALPTFHCRHRGGAPLQIAATQDRLLRLAPDPRREPPAVLVYLPLRHAPGVQEAAEHPVLQRHGPRGLLHLQRGLDAAPLMLPEPPLEVLDVLAPARARAALVVAVLGLRVGRFVLRQLARCSIGGGESVGLERQAEDPSDSHLSRHERYS